MFGRMGAFGWVNHGRCASRVLFATVTVGAALLLPSVANASSPLTLGFNDGAFSEQWNTINQADLLNKENAAEATSARAMQRFTLSWRLVQPSVNNGCSAGAIDWTPGLTTQNDYQAEYDRLVAADIDPVIVVMDAPQWAQGNLSCGLLGSSCQPSQNCHTPPGDPYLSAWGAFVKQLALHFDKAAAIEVWNEPNARHFWGASEGPNVARYMRVFRYAADAVHQANDQTAADGHDISVLTAGLVFSYPYQLGPPEDRILVDVFTAGMYSNGLLAWMRPIDALGVHAYPWGQWGCLDPNPTTGTALDQCMSGHNRFNENLAQVRTPRNNAGDTDRKLWVTETGMSELATADDTTGPLNRRYRQCKIIVATLDRLETESDIPVALIHSAVDRPSGVVPTLQDQLTGVLALGTLAPKLAYNGIIAQRTGAAPECGTAPLPGT
jgi:hypothetical protein